MPTLADVNAHLASHGEFLRTHPFLAWVATPYGAPVVDEEDRAALRRHVRDRLSWHVLLANFIMGFRDLNLYHLRYEEPTTEQHEAIGARANANAHDTERYLTDLETLARGGDRRLPISEILWLLHHDALTTPFRDFVALVMRFVSDNRTRPVMLYTLIESLAQICDALFASTATLSTAYRRAGGEECVYWGDRDRDELRSHAEAFPGTLELTDIEFAFALDHIDRLFGAFVDLCNRMLAYGQTSRANHDARSIAWTLLQRRHDANVGRWLALDVTRCEPRTTALELWPPWTRDGLHTTQRLISRRWGAWRRRLHGHPALAYLRDAARGDRALEITRALTLIWAPRILGSHSFWRTIGSYPERADSAARRRLNAHAARFQAAPAMFYADWNTLALDELLDWRPEEALRFWFLDELLERQRRSAARLVRLAARNPDPVIRYWFMVAVETGADAVLQAAAPLAQRLEGENAVQPLHYWSGRHSHAHDLPPPDAEACALHPARLPLSLDRAETSVRVLDEILGDMHELLDEHTALVETLCERLPLKPVALDCVTAPRPASAMLLRLSSSLSPRIS